MKINYYLFLMSLSFRLNLAASSSKLTVSITNLCVESCTVLLKIKLFAILPRVRTKRMKLLDSKRSGHFYKIFSAHFTNTLRTAQALKELLPSIVTCPTLVHPNTSEPKISFISYLKTSCSSMALLSRKLIS